MFLSCVSIKSLVGRQQPGRLLFRKYLHWLIPPVQTGTSFQVRFVEPQSSEAGALQSVVYHFHYSGMQVAMCIVIIYFIVIEQQCR